MSEKFQKFILSMVGVLVMSILVSYLVFAWTEPSQNPPGGNVFPPLNTSINAQAKEGALVIGTNSALSTGLIVQYGNVGIGTWAPNHKLTISSSASGSSVQMNIYNPTAGTGQVAGIRFHTASGWNVMLRTNQDTAWLELTDANGNWVHRWSGGNYYASGNVGIGTTNPGYALTIFKNGTPWSSFGITKYPQLMVNGNNQTGGGIAISDDGGFFDWNDGYVTYEPLCCGQGLRVRRSNLIVDNNVGIGTTAPSGKLSVYMGSFWGSVHIGGSNADLWFDGGSDSVFWISNRGASSGRTSITYGDTELFTVSNNGNVGIGTWAPGYKLEVVGSVGADGYYYRSDIKLKENVSEIKDALEKILKLQGVNFTWKGSGEKSIGLIAQDVEKIFPELVKTDNSGVKSIDYGRLTAVLIEGIKEQQKEIDLLKQEIENLKIQIKGR